MRHSLAVLRMLPGGALLAVFVLVCLLPGCSGAAAAPTAAPRLIVYNWQDDLPRSVLNDFSAETGIPVDTQAFISMEDAMKDLRRGAAYDVVNLSSRLIPQAVSEGLLLPLDRASLPNFRHISPNFRDLVFDPGNRYTVPYNWGISGILFRRDLVRLEPSRWGDLWQLRYSGKIVLWRGNPRMGVGLALRSLGYSANSEDERHLRVAEDLLLTLRPQALFLEDYGLASPTPLLESGAAVAALGFAADARRVKDDPRFAFVLPADGALLWMENFVIPSASRHPQQALRFLDYLLRPQTAAQIANVNLYATVNQSALPLIDPELRADPLIFPPQQALMDAEIILPISAEAERRYAQIWQAFTEGGQP